MSDNGAPLGSWTPPGGFERTFTLAEVVDVFRRHLHLPDPGALYAVLAAVAANRLDGDPVWLVLVGPSGGGKTEILNALAGLEDVHAVATLSGEAALLSGTSRKERAADAKGGLLREVGEYGVLVLKDFGSILSMHRDARASVLAALREVFDGAWTRRVGVDGGKMLSWEGKLGLVAGCVPAIDQHHAVMGQLGERFLLYRLAVEEAPEHARRSLAHVGGIRAMREELRTAVYGLFAAIEDAKIEFSDSDTERLVALSTLVVRARSPVIRDTYSSREIELVPDAEAPGRLVVMLGLLLLGLRQIGAPEQWRVVAKTALDSMPALRRQALETLVATSGAMPTTDVANALDVPTTTARRVLEDMTAHRVFERIPGGKGVADEWRATAWLRETWRQATLPEMSEDPLFITPDTPSDDISGKVPEAAQGELGWR